MEDDPFGQGQESSNTASKSDTNNSSSDSKSHQEPLSYDEEDPFGQSETHHEPSKPQLVAISSFFHDNPDSEVTLALSKST